MGGFQQPDRAVLLDSGDAYTPVGVFGQQPDRGESRRRDSFARAATRTGLSKREFVIHFKDRMIPDEVSHSVYDYFSTQIGNHLVDPEDTLVDFYEFDGNRLEEAFDSLCSDLRLNPATLKAADAELGHSLRTVADMVLLMNRAVRHHSENPLR